MSETPVRAGYDTVAATYDEQFCDELDHKPLDRALLDAICEMTPAGTLADIGCGPGHITRFLADRHDDLLGVDLSPEMIDVARRRYPHLTFTVASMLDLPHPDAAFTGMVAMYSIIHLDPAERLLAFAEFSRTLRPGAPLLVSFHVDGPGMGPGDVNHLRTFLGHPVDMDGYFLDPAIVTTDLVTNGFRIYARVDREPFPDIEFPSRRCYILAHREVRSAHGP